MKINYQYGMAVQFSENRGVTGEMNIQFVQGLEDTEMQTDYLILVTPLSVTFNLRNYRKKGTFQFSNSDIFS